MKKIQAHIAEIQRRARQINEYNNFVQAVQQLSPRIIELFVQQLEAGEDGDGGAIGTYEPKTIRNKRWKGTFTDNTIKLNDTGEWRSGLRVEVVDGMVVIKGDPEYKELYFKGETSGGFNHPWAKGREAIMMLNDQNRELIEQEIQRLMQNV